MKLWIEDSTVVIQVDGREERHAFDTAEEADIRRRFIEELLTWNGTPFVDCACVKGPNGAVDCAMLLWASATEVGLIRGIPRPKYSPRIVYKREENFVKFLESLGAVEVASPRIGDVHVYFWGRCFGHGAVRINERQILHSYAAAGCTKISHVDEPLLNFFQRHDIRRPVRYFNIWKSQCQL